MAPPAAASGDAWPMDKPDVPPEKYQELANRYRFHFFKRQDDICVFDGILPLLADLRARGEA